MPAGPPDLLRTPRLVLRRPVPEDALRVFRAYARDPEVTRYLTWRPHERPDETRAWMLKALAGWTEMRALTWMIQDSEQKEIVGAVELRLESQANLGFVLARPYWNRGFMTEAVREVLLWASGREEIERIWALCAVENVASARVLEKAGLEREALLRRWMVFPNLGEEPRDCYRYARQA